MIFVSLFFVETVSEMSTEVDGGMKRQDKCVETDRKSVV